MVAIVSGYVIGKLKLEHLVEEYVYQMKVGQSEIVEMNLSERMHYAIDYGENPR